MKNNNKIGVLSIQGLPARHGAFEQTIDQFVKYNERANTGKIFYVACSQALKSELYEVENVNRLYFKRNAGFGVIAYGLKSFFSMYCRGIRVYLVMGYGLAPFFTLFSMLRCKIICNVDGFEWRRAKWGYIAKKYFKLCEWFAVKSNAELIFDSVGVARYYEIIHHRNGHTLFYGTEKNKTNSYDAINDSNLKTLYYVVVMRMEPENHILEIVKAFTQSNSKLSLLLIGPSTDFFQNNVLPLLNSDPGRRIRYLGSIYEREKLHALRAGAVAYVHGHSVGGTNPTLVEACEISRPIIAYDSIFNREVLGKSAKYFNSIKTLTQIFNQTVDSYPLPPELDQRYTWEYVCKGYLNVLS